MLPTPRACGWRSLTRNANRPLTSSVATTARSHRLHTDERATTGLVLRRASSFTAAARSVRSPLGKERRATTSGRLLPYRARCLATSLKLECGFDPANRASHTRSPRPRSYPHRKGERTTPWLDRACDAVPARLAATLHDERTGHRPEMRATSFLPTTLRRRAPTFSFGDPVACSPCEEPSGCMARFHDAPRTSDRAGSCFRSGRSLPATSTDCASSDAPVTALRLSSSSSWPYRRRPPFPHRETRRCLRARGQDHSPTSIRDDRREYG